MAIRDEARFVRPRFLPGIELVSTAYRGRRFPMHSHPEYVVGAVVEGAETLRAGGRNHVAGAGATLFLHPGQPHANAAIGDAVLGYRVFYIAESALPAPLSFREPVSRAPDLLAAITGAHASLSASHDRLEQESALHALIEVLTRHGSAPRLRAATAQSQARLAKAYIDAHFAESFGLSVLAEVTGLSVFQLLRAFKAANGLTPLAYRNQVRLAEARRLLRRGESVAGTASAVGFADQSHLTRHFQRVVGVSPGRYAQ